MTKKNKKGGLPPIAYIFMAIVTFFLITNIYPRIKPTVVNNNNNNIVTLAENMSIGNRILIADGDNKITPEKQQGKEYFAKGDYTEAERQFQKSIQQKPNDPEGVIYRNNSQVMKDKNYLKIGVVVPIGSNANVAQEMLRGVASSQTEINQKGGINGKKLLIQIVDDKNDPDISKQVAKELIKDEQILAVIGSNASNSSLAAAPIYKAANLVMITPTSLSDAISTLAWRVVPSTKIAGNLLADYVVNRAKKTKLAICYDSSAIDAVSFKDEFVSSLLSNKATIIPLVCDLSKANLDTANVINEAINQKADGLFLVSHIDHVEKVIKLGRENQGKLPLFSSSTMYNIKTLENGDLLKNLILTTVYHPDLNPSFAKKMEQEWKGRVSWRTATSYDATNVIISAMKQAENRTEIINVLHNPQFSIEGATGTVKFDNNGDRITKPVIVQVQEKGFKNYDFAIVN